MADDREPLGRIVHETRLAFNAELEHPRGLLPWEERHPSQRELDMRIASAVAARAVADAKLRNERLEAQVSALGANVPAIRRALVIAITEAEWESEKQPYRAALKALDIGGEEGDGSG